MDLLMGVIVQVMVPATASAVVFTVDPVTGVDHVAVAEIAPGPGADLVGGRVTAQTYRYDWLDQRPVSQDPALVDDAAPPAEASPVSPLALGRLWEAVWRIQEWAGVPCDIEAVFNGDEMSVVQSRPVTSIGHAGLEDVWTTANFRDGGVASAVFPPFMRSLYEYIWERVFGDFLVGSGMLPVGRRRRGSRVFYGRLYWNARLAKEAMGRVPGYVEREFDEDLGIAPTYQGNGAVTQLNPRTALTVARVGVTEIVWLRRRLRVAAQLKARLEATYEARLAELAAAQPGELPALLRAITKNDYYASESTYFQQVFLNQVHQALFKSTMLRHTDLADYLALIGGLGHGPAAEELLAGNQGAGAGPDGAAAHWAVSHLEPFYELWELSRRILADPPAARWWTKTAPEAIAAALEEHGAGRSGQAAAGAGHLADLGAWLERFGYHSERELDITEPSFAENPAAVVRQLQANLALGEEASPQRDAERAEATRTAALDRLRAKVSPRRYRSLVAKIRQMRELLWRREAFRDVSTKNYHLIRQTGLRLAEYWTASGMIDQPEDLWFLEIGQIWAAVEGRTQAEQLREQIARHRRYFTAYRNYRGPDEIGAGLTSQPRGGRGAARQQLQGIGCQASTGRGRARVIDSLEQIGLLEQGDILVTRFTDTGWTPAFARLGGVVTEYGGMLCHAAIVSREFAIPCVVALAGATTAIPDGALIEVDGATGAVTLLEVD
jgi:pyruvate,water dikinase